MTKNPFINALSGLLYIVLVVSLVYYAPKSIDQTANVFLPIMMLSLFVFSAAFMGYVFMYQPLQLFLEGDKKKSLALFIRTLIAFGVSASTLVLIGFYLLAQL